MSVVRIDPDNKVSVPKEVLEKLGARPGDLIEAEFGRLVDVPYTDEPIGPEAQKSIDEGRKDLDAGRCYGPFDSAEELIKHLKSSLPEDTA